MKKIILGLALTSIFCATPAMANSAQIAVAKKAILKGEVMPYATPELKRNLQQAYKINDRMQQHPNYEPMGCEFASAFYLGHGNGGPEPQDFKNFKFTTLKNGYLQANYTVWGDKVSTKFKMVCKGNNCLIDDVLSDFGSLKSEAKTMVKTNRCAF